MQNALWLASVFGPFLLILGLWYLLYQENVHKIITSIKNTPSVFYLSGVFNLLIGIVIISQFNVWSMSLSFLVTLLGWVLFLKGIMTLFLPRLLMKVKWGNESFIRTMGIIPLIWGFALCWFAFF